MDVGAQLKQTLDVKILDTDLLYKFILLLPLHVLHQIGLSSQVHYLSWDKEACSHLPHKIPK